MVAVPGGVWYGVGEFIRVRGYQTVFNVTPPYTVSTEKHQSFSFVGGQLNNLEWEVSEVKTVPGVERIFLSPPRR